MARRDLIVVIDAAGRDKDKVFKITEMDAMAAEEWAIRALLALTRANPDLGVIKNVESLGWQGVAALGLKAFGGIAFAEAKPLLDEMMSCVQIIPNPKDVRIVRDLFPGDIEEISTRVKLRAEVFNIHANFSELAAKLKSKLTATGDQDGTPSIETSLQPSGPSSQRSKPR